MLYQDIEKWKKAVRIKGLVYVEQNLRWSFAINQRPMHEGKDPQRVGCYDKEKNIGFVE